MNESLLLIVIILSLGCDGGVGDGASTRLGWFLAADEAVLACLLR